jgi:hypothetical protein
MNIKFCLYLSISQNRIIVPADWLEVRSTQALSISLLISKIYSPQPELR